MDYVTSLADLPVLSGTAVTIGKFDGLHRGHRRLVDNVLRQKEMGRRAIMAAIDVNGQWILSRRERRFLCERLGIDLLAELPFTPSLRDMTAKDFVREILLGSLGASYVTVGESFRFGKGRAGDALFLRNMGKEYGFTVEIAPSVMDGKVKVSSTTIRQELSLGNMERVSSLLGAAYFAEGSVVHGKGLGKKSLLPTINVVPEEEKLLPPNGVYFTRTHLEGKSFEGITNVGCKPTVQGEGIGIETHLFSCEGDLYGKWCRTEFLHHSRPERTFASLAELKERLEADQREGRAFFEKLREGENK
ncbi:MAG: riboflavin biosynthesis protein RibF [Blautia sp.]|nr:riboflavin biosynthesis protein RibF [Blautia sp.]